VAATVVNLKDEPIPHFDVYIGRQMPPSMSPTGEYLARSKWANPFKVGGTVPAMSVSTTSGATW
jgi:hypothetical protein